MSVKNNNGTSFKFERIEKKFWMSQEQFAYLKPFLERNTVKDEHGDSLICNIYYDTPDCCLIRRSIERPYFKEKIRIRSYGIPEDTSYVFAELKRKLDGVGYKRRICVPFSDAKKLMRGEPINSGNTQIEKEILDFVARYNPVPVVYLTYSRYAMYLKTDKNFRITIDKNIMYRTTDIENPGNDCMFPVMSDSSRILMEVKAAGGIPEDMLRIMSENKIFQAPYSKVGACYMNHMASYPLIEAVNQ